MAVSKRTRYEVLKRDNHTCRYCGGTAPDVFITVDHVVPVSLGGSDEPSNLVAACKDCNAGKSSSSPDGDLVEDVKQDALRWSAAMKLSADRMTARTEPMREYGRAFSAELSDYGLTGRDLPNTWQDSIETFYKAGLPIDQLMRALAISMSKSGVAWSEKFRYMCGICWSMLREMQDEARAILEEDDGAR